MWFGAAEAADAEEDQLHGREQTGEEMPDWVADKKRRAEKIRNAKAELEAEAKAAAQSRGRGGREARSRGTQETRTESRPTLYRARCKSPEELHRFR